MATSALRAEPSRHLLRDTLLPYAYYTASFGNEVRAELTGHMRQLCAQCKPAQMLLFGSYTLAHKNCRHVYCPTRRGV
jgi:hypothetical protein